MPSHPDSTGSFKNKTLRHQVKAKDPRIRFQIRPAGFSRKKMQHFCNSYLYFRLDFALFEVIQTKFYNIY